MGGAWFSPPVAPVRACFARPCLVAWGAGELCSPRTIAGGCGNPLRVPMSTIVMVVANATWDPGGNR